MFARNRLVTAPVRTLPGASVVLGAVCSRVWQYPAAEREGNNLKGVEELFPKWLKPRPKSVLDCLLCAEFTQQRSVDLYSYLTERVNQMVSESHPPHKIVHLLFTIAN